MSGPRPLQQRPHPRRQELPQLRPTRGKVRVAVLIADLPRVLVRRLRARPVLGEIPVDSRSASDGPEAALESASPGAAFSWY
ncbi:hypothetical protein [Streptomyces sp. NPDC051286]|uniref:hypothetical protein n=1 Tax=Streptomyces sp. NPDC051286 TaxID=3365647 RepID=UPI0037B01220